MMSRRVFMVGLLAAAVVVAAVGLWLSLPLDRITPENAARIKPGMSLKETNVLLGQQGHYIGEQMPGAAGENQYIWHGSLGMIRVAFRGDLTATDPAEFTEVDSLRLRLRRWLGL